MLGRRIDGILGGAFIEQFVLELDYQALRITLHDRAKFEYSGPGESVPIEINAAGHPVVKAQVTPAGGQPIAGAFLLDIGSGGALALHSPFVAQHRLLGPHLKTVPVIGVGGAGGQVRGRFGRVAELQIGGFKFAQPIALFSEDQAGAFANASLAGNIGGLIARRFRIFLDYSRRRVILEPSAAFSEPFDRAFAGLSVAAEGADYRTFRVRQVLDDSPASEAGIRPGDVITAMDGKGASGLTLADIQQMLERPATYEVTIRRGEQVVKTTLTPKKML
jgi:membrane-associated protease RseP (regulator of RpoE activity)